MSTEFLTEALPKEQREVLQYIKEFVQRCRETSGNLYEVLNAFPGHGKTTMLKLFVQKSLTDDAQQIGGLIVLREKEQLREFEAFLGQENVLYVDSGNIFDVVDQIPNYQFVLITHERLKNLVLLRRGENAFLQWGNKKRVIFIDEAPSFFSSSVFTLNSNLKWLDDCFKVLGNEIAAAEIVMIRSYVQIVIARELLENNGLQTTALQHQLESTTYRREMERFFQKVSDKIADFRTVDSLNTFSFFKQMYEKNHIGFIDPALHLPGFIDHKKIICSDRIDYRILGCSILIFDGTVKFSQAIYNGEYIIKEIENRIDYRRLYLHYRKVNTSARQRKANKRVSVQQIIAKDIEGISLEGGLSPFPLMNKDEIQLYRELGTIDEFHYRRYFKKEKDKKNPINILNTVGKNYLREQEIFYLTSLPNRPPEHYKAIAVSLYKNDPETLNLSTIQKDKKHMNNWFADERIELVYHEMLLSEINQIIHRSKIRNLVSEDQVHIYIATNSDETIARIRNMFEGHRFSFLEIEGDLSFESTVDEKAIYVAKTLRERNISKEVRIGSIDDGHKVKSFLNKEWNDEKKQDKIIERFKHFGVDIYVLSNGEKRVKLMK